MELIDKSFLKAPKNYIIQSLLAMFVLGVILYFVNIITHAAIVAGLGASVFIAFAMPRSITARPRRLIGGHLVGIICGLISYYLFFIGPFAGATAEIEAVRWFAYAFSVGLAMFLMSVTLTEHPPGASTALGIAITGFEIHTISFILICAVGLSIVKRLLRPFLIDLF